MSAATLFLDGECECCGEFGTTYRVEHVEMCGRCARETEMELAGYDQLDSEWVEEGL